MVHGCLLVHPVKNNMDCNNLWQAMCLELTVHKHTKSHTTNHSLGVQLNVVKRHGVASLLLQNIPVKSSTISVWRWSFFIPSLIGQRLALYTQHQIISTLHGSWDDVLWISNLLYLSERQYRRRVQQQLGQQQFSWPQSWALNQSQICPVVRTSDGWKGPAWVLSQAFGLKQTAAID